VSRTVRTLITKGLLAKAEVQPRGRAEVLDLTVHEALGVFAGERDVRARLQPQVAVGAAVGVR